MRRRDRAAPPTRAPSARRCLAAAEDEVVGTRPSELQLRLLDQEEVLDRLGERPEAIFGRSLELAQLVLRFRQRQAAVEIDLERLEAM